MSGYDATAGAFLWRTKARGATLHAVGDGRVVAAEGPLLTLLDVTNGEIDWSRDAGSPGQSFWHEWASDGSYRLISGNDDVVVGLIVAERPYRD